MLYRAMVEAALGAAFLFARLSLAAVMAARRACVRLRTLLGGPIGEVVLPFGSAPVRR
jgi:hypothetical protein